MFAWEYVNMVVTSRCFAFLVLITQARIWKVFEFKTQQVFFIYPFLRWLKLGKSWQTSCVNFVFAYTDISVCLFFFVQKKTKYTSAEDKISYINKTINATTGNYTLEKVVKPGSKTVPDGTMTDPKGSLNVLGLVVFSIVFGVVLGRIGERGMPLKAFFEALNEVIMKMVALVMW